MNERAGAGVHRWGTAPDFQGPRHELRESLLLDAFLAARPGHVVLDVGAASGTFSNRLSAQGFDVTSTDVTVEALDVLRMRVSGAVQAGRRHVPPFADASFHGVIPRGRPRTCRGRRRRFDPRRNVSSTARNPRRHRATQPRMVCAKRPLGQPLSPLHPGGTGKPGGVDGVRNPDLQDMGSSRSRRSTAARVRMDRRRRRHT